MATLQRRVMALGCDPGLVNGQFTAQTRAAVLKALTNGPDAPIDNHDIDRAADRLGAPSAAVRSVIDVESTGTPFVDGRPTILFEPHRFSRATGHRFDETHPALSSRAWNPRLYPAAQAARWAQLLDAVALDVDAGFASASYGAFQILGENHDWCGAATAWAFAWQQSRSAGAQLDAFVMFVEARGLRRALQNRDWPAFARGYNGTAFRENRYDVRLAAAYARRAA
ncbi:hypothetical protein FHS97_000969 [Sphingomonas endophytica]|uniref:N-acetylmuramidase domain-containing protein n=1 Tax=Sphingomonas endophytica TaxID=869719 RepID=A0ABR6N2S2_9SPHN|nr:hypothetical protein [Sphingomonas endophytica]